MPVALFTVIVLFTQKILILFGINKVIVGMYRKILRVGNKTARVNVQNFVTGFKGGMNANDGVCTSLHDITECMP